MKKSLTFLLIICVTLLVAQESTSSFTENDGERKRNPRMDQLSYVPNEIIVKFKDETAISTASRIKAAGISSVDEVLKKYEIAALERIFPEAKKPARARSVRSPQGKDIKVPSLDKIYRMMVPEAEANLARPASIHAVIEELKKLPEVEYAEPNYIYSIDELQQVGPELNASDLAGMKVGKQSTSPSAVVPNDPLFGQQSYLREIKVDLAWAQTTGDTTQVIAILDTGVDWTHPDLKNKIWRNWGEIPDNGIDDDGNGYIDDVRGWDFIFNDNNPMDDNSHGTHVAGIAAAETNNGIGIAGVNWNAKVMPVKVFPASGRGDVITITNGILYATRMGATVMNMSFGSYAKSFTLENALLNAYPTSIPVAGAGNDSKSIYDIDAFGNPQIFYPAALSYVFGIQATEGFSNYDPDGPFISLFGAEALNYELKAPGIILSTVPKGNYRKLAGTSMSTPIVSGTVSMYRSANPDKTIEELWSDFVCSANEIINVQNVLFNTYKSPRLDIVSFEINDQNENCDLDNNADAGEIINLILDVRNTGQPAQKVYAKLKPANDGNANDIILLQDSVNFGSIGIYRSLKNELNPYKIKISNSSANNSMASIDVHLFNEVDTAIFIQNIKFGIYNGHELSGIILRDTTLTADKKWIINKSLRISSGVTVTLEPGVIVEILANIDNRGKIIAVGSQSQLIYIKGVLSGNVVLKNVVIDCNGGSLNIQNPLSNCKINNIETIECPEIRHCHIEFLYSNANLMKCNTSQIVNSYIRNANNYFYANLIEDTFFEECKHVSFKHVNFFNRNVIHKGVLYAENMFQLTGSYQSFKYNYLNKLEHIIKYLYPWFPEIEHEKNPVYVIGIDKYSDGYMKYNSFITKDLGTYFVKTEGNDNLINLPNHYWGSNNYPKIVDKFFDFNLCSSLPYLDINPLLTSPSDSCHAHIWKILVNYKDSQDEFVEPIGVGKHRFDVFFNRPMNKKMIPEVSFGSIFPYTSIPINEDGSWSEDGRVYTVYKTIKLTTGDGINKIRVAGAKEINGWDFEIPVEDSRFSFIIAAASSASTEFMATPGLGKVNLEWNHNDLEDGLGYNMYRMEHINDSTLTQPVIVNSSLITDTLYTDYSVVPNKKYYYYYKILRTNMAETDSSRVVSAIPFTASKGDANGDLSVNVLDITTIVAHLLNNNPQPFIREAADVNSDSQINVLDIVGVVNLVLNVPQNAPGIAMNKQVDLYLQNDTLFANSNVDIAAVQLDINGVEKFSDLEVLKALKPFESGNSYSNGSMRVIFYSMSGKSIEPGQSIPLLKLKAESVINDVIIGEPSGSSVKVNYIKTRIPDLSTNMNQNMVELGQNYPNPVSEKANTIIPVKIYEPVEKMILRITNLMGQETYVSELYNLKEGRYEFNWNTTNESGVYFYCVEFVSNGKRLVCPAMKMIVN